MPRRAGGCGGRRRRGGAAAGRSASTPRRSTSSTSSTGIGPATAQKILDWRKQHGGFGSVDDLKQISGIGPKRFEALKDKVRM